MSDRKWSFQNALGYIFNAFATVTDWKLEKEEIHTIYNVIREWMPKDMSDDAVKECVIMTNGWVNADLKESYEADKDKPTAIVSTNIYGLANWLNEVFNKMDNPEKQKKFFLGDLVKIAMSDDHFHDMEKKWIKGLAGQLEVDYNV